MKRYSVMVTEYGSDREIEICQLDGNPEPTIKGLKAKKLTVDGQFSSRIRIQKYSNIRIVDNQEEGT
jgi:predicted secreted protein